jgi:hypothetical protein
MRREVDVPKINRAVVITIDPESKMLFFREKGCRREFGLPIATAFMLAIKVSEKGG